ncbi:MAG: CBM35 domain-containing protein [Lachnospiraceae bacterium]
MKKLLCAVLAFCLLLAPTAVTAHAEEDVTTLYAVEVGEENLTGLDDATEKTDHALYDEAYGYIGLKSANADGKVIFHVNVETAGKYELRVVYTAKEGSSARKMNLDVNGSLTKNINLTTAADWDTFQEYKVYIQLTAGANTIVVGTPSDYDNDSVKTPNIYAIQYVLKEAAAPATDTKDTEQKPASGTYENGTYTVVRGDYLRSIAKATLGKESLWKSIYEANKDIISNPDLIFPGMKLVIPE